MDAPMDEQKKVRVILAEDHVILRQGLRMLLEGDSVIEVAGEVSNGLELLEFFAENPADVVLMDVNMPVMDGFEATQQLLKQYPEAKVLALSMHNSVPFVHKMLSCGASGYLLKTSTREELCAAVKLVAGGTPYICGELSIKMLERTLEPASFTEPLPSDRKGLSKREVEVLTLIAEGYTNVEIADKLFTSKRTVETHRQNILEKTQAKNTANLIKYAIENRIIGTAR